HLTSFATPCDLTFAAVITFFFQIARQSRNEIIGEIIKPCAVTPDLGGELVVGGRRWNSGDQANSGRQQSFGDTGRDNREAGVLRLRDADETVHDAPYGSEQADEGCH